MEQDDKITPFAPPRSLQAANPNEETIISHDYNGMRDNKVELRTTKATKKKPIGASARLLDQEPLASAHVKAETRRPENRNKYALLCTTAEPRRGRTLSLLQRFAGKRLPCTAVVCVNRGKASGEPGPTQPAKFFLRGAKVSGNFR